MINFGQVSIDCAQGDNIVIQNADRSSTLYNHCKQQTGFIVIEATYVFLSLLTSSPLSRLLSASFKYYTIETASISSSAPISTTLSTISTASTFGTLSTGAAQTTLSTATTKFPTISTSVSTAFTTNSTVLYPTSTFNPTQSKSVFLYLFNTKN